MAFILTKLKYVGAPTAPEESMWLKKQVSNLELLKLLLNVLELYILHTEK